MCCLAVYDVSGAASDRNCVVLSDIHIDIMDYIQPASCTDAEFRQMWAEFEWENKVSFFCLYITLLMRYNSVSCSPAARYSSIIYCHINLIQHPHWMFVSSSLFSYSYLTSFTSLAMQ